jgi:uridine kinase
VLLGVDGGAGAGKTTFTDWLAARIRELGTSVATLHIDNFFRPAAERVGYPSPLAVTDDIDWERLRDEAILPLRAGRAARPRLYDWPTDSFRTRAEVEPGGIVIIDGVTSLRRELRARYGLRIWLSCHRDLRVARLARRQGSSDAEIRRWLPSEDQYVAEHEPRGCAHLVLRSASEDEDAGTGGWQVVRWSLPGPDR